MYYTEIEKLRIVNDLERRAAELRAAIKWGYDLSDQKVSIEEMRRDLDSLEEIVNKDIQKVQS